MMCLDTRVRFLEKKNDELREEVVRLRRENSRLATIMLRLHKVLEQELLNRSTTRGY